MRTLIIILSLLYSYPGEAASQCPGTKLVGFDGVINNTDASVIQTALRECKKRYPKSPCLVKVVKSEGPHYDITCGASK